MNQDNIVPRDSTNLCIECGGSRIAERIMEQAFPYGSHGDEVQLTASMPVFTCLDCGYEYFDERGEAARHAAVCRHSGVQTPEEIRKTREATGLTRAEFCHLTGFGSASLQRWEAGSIIPNTSSDRLMFLLRYPENVERLMERVNAVSQGLSPFIPASRETAATQESPSANR